MYMPSPAIMLHLDFNFIERKFFNVTHSVLSFGDVFKQNHDECTWVSQFLQSTNRN